MNIIKEQYSPELWKGLLIKFPNDIAPLTLEELKIVHRLEIILAYKTEEKEGFITSSLGFDISNINNFIEDIASLNRPTNIIRGKDNSNRTLNKVDIDNLREEIVEARINRNNKKFQLLDDIDSATSIEEVELLIW